MLDKLVRVGILGLYAFAAAFSCFVIYSYMTAPLPLWIKALAVGAISVTVSTGTAFVVFSLKEVYRLSKEIAQLDAEIARHQRDVASL